MWIRKCAGVCSFLIRDAIESPWIGTTLPLWDATGSLNQYHVMSDLNQYRVASVWCNAISESVPCYLCLMQPNPWVSTMRFFKTKALSFSKPSHLSFSKTKTRATLQTQLKHLTFCTTKTLSSFEARTSTPSSKSKTLSCFKIKTSSFIKANRIVRLQTQHICLCSKSRQCHSSKQGRMSLFNIKTRVLVQNQGTAVLRNQGVCPSSKWRRSSFFKIQVLYFLNDTIVLLQSKDACPFQNQYTDCPCSNPAHCSFFKTNTLTLFNTKTCSRLSKSRHCPCSKLTYSIEQFRWVRNPRLCWMWRNPLLGVTGGGGGGAIGSPLRYWVRTLLGKPS